LRHFGKALRGVLKFRDESDGAHGIVLRDIAADSAQVALSGRRQYYNH
jgi:hypothetical protein